MARYRFIEVASSVYAWDMHDEGVDSVLDNLQDLSHVNSVYLIALMHKERHPWPNDTFFPHNPIRREYMTEDSVAYWQPDFNRYDGIRPAVPGNFLAGQDWLELLVDRAKTRGLKVGVELSHTMLGSDRLAAEYPDVRQIDIFGKPLATTHIGENHFVPCMNNPDFRRYVQQLFCEVSERYPIDYVLNCIMPFPLPAKYLLTEYEEEMEPWAWITRSPVGSGCFCPSCVKRAKEAGFDLLKARDGLLKLAEYEGGTPALKDTNISPMELLLEHREFMDWLEFKCMSVTSFYEELNTALKRVRPDIDNRMNVYITSHSEYAGFRVSKVAKHFDSMRACVYTENLGTGLTEKKRKVLMSLRKTLGKDYHILSAIGVLPGSTPDSVREGIRVSAECGAQSIALGHYDGATLDMLRAVGEAAETE